MFKFELDEIATDLTEQFDKLLTDIKCPGVNCRECPLYSNSEGSCALPMIRGILHDTNAYKVAQEKKKKAERLRKLREAIENLHTMADDAFNNLSCTGISCADCPASLAKGICGFSRAAEILESCKCMTDKRSESDE